MRKIAILCLALVMALGSLGVAYAAWTDTLTIDGTVDTGTVEIDIVGYSETHVYKVPEHGMMVVRTFMDLAHIVLWHSIDDGPLVAGPPPIPPGSEVIASATVTTIDHYAESVTVAYDNLFPGPVFATDLLVHYNGTIPARINDITFAPNEAMQGMIADGLLFGDEARRIDNSVSPPAIGEVVDIGTQLHQCEHVGLVLWVEVPQIDALQGRSGTATYTVEVVQWDKYPY